VLASEVADGLAKCATEMIRQIESGRSSKLGATASATLGKADPDADLVLRFPGS
jgi:hypothetical protein